MVVLINPVSNPDGRDKQVEWFYRFLKGKTDPDTLPRQSPPYWSKYAFVDINRDAQLDMPVGRGHVVAFNFNPLYRDSNRGDQRMLWNAIINWQAILAPARSPAAH